MPEKFLSRNLRNNFHSSSVKKVWHLMARSRPRSFSLGFGFLLLILSLGSVDRFLACSGNIALSKFQKYCCGCWLLLTSSYSSCMISIDLCEIVFSDNLSLILLKDDISVIFSAKEKSLVSRKLFRLADEGR